MASGEAAPSSVNYAGHGTSTVADCFNVYVAPRGLSGATDRGRTGRPVCAHARDFGLGRRGRLETRTSKNHAVGLEISSRRPVVGPLKSAALPPEITRRQFFGQLLGTVIAFLDNALTLITLASLLILGPAIGYAVISCFGWQNWSVPIQHPPLASARCLRCRE
jgi:hypothetical protein